MAAMIPDPNRRWVKGTEYIAQFDEYTMAGTCVGVGTSERAVNARACGVCYASKINPIPRDFIDDLMELFM